MRDPETRALALGLYGATVGLLVVANVAADAFLVHRVMGLYWILFGSLVALDLAARRREREEPVPSGPVVRRGP